MEKTVKLFVLFACSVLTPASAEVYGYNPTWPGSNYDQGTVTCGDTSASYDNLETTFTNPSYPAAEMTALGSCSVRIKHVSERISQIRFDFDEFTLAQPNSEGICDTDFLSISGASSKIPVICGDNSGQHMYVDVSPDDCYFSFSVDTASMGSKWSIRVTQIEFYSPLKAPPGCLQYFNSTVGTITSFNYSPTPNAATRQLANQKYGVCISTQPGYCSVTYRQADNSQYSLSGDIASVAPGLLAPAEVGSACINDYLLVPNGAVPDTSDIILAGDEPSDRFCGLYFPSVTNSIPPFNIYVVTNGVEAQESDINNSGFKLSYRMNLC